VPINKDAYLLLKSELDSARVTLIAVSKTKTIADIQALYDLGHRDFGENYVQELVQKAGQLPKDIRWHFIGHLQTNKVKLIVPFVQLIHGVDSLKLLLEISKQAFRAGRVVDCLLQVHIAKEETKFGLDQEELLQLMKDLDNKEIVNARICGLMGMASFTENAEQVRSEFRDLKNMFDKISEYNKDVRTLSMGMSADYRIAIEEGSNMVRIGSLVFGERS
jgi:pyridoxal phosphate enzyme (YggS family)